MPFVTFCPNLLKISTRLQKCRRGRTVKRGPTFWLWPACHLQPSSFYGIRLCNQKGDFVSHSVLKERQDHPAPFPVVPACSLGGSSLLPLFLDLSLQAYAIANILSPRLQPWELDDSDLANAISGGIAGKANNHPGIEELQAQMRVVRDLVIQPRKHADIVPSIPFVLAASFSCSFPNFLHYKRNILYSNLASLRAL